MDLMDGTSSGAKSNQTTANNTFNVDDNWKNTMLLSPDPSLPATSSPDLSNNLESDKKRPLETSMDENENKTNTEISSAKKKQKVDDDKDNEETVDMKMEEEKETFGLLISNFPYQWTCDQISEYIQEHCIEVYALEQLDGGNPETGQTIRLLFLDFEKCNQARKQLKLKALDGRKLSVTFSVPDDSDSDEDSDKTLLIKRTTGLSPREPSPSKPELDIWAPDPRGVYGLKPEYLESLAIAPPLDKWVHVSNFRCDKSELKEVMELAGHVVICAVVTISNRYAKVMYSHPLEAVQAVSMLNGQIFYGQVLKVSLYKCLNNEIILPKGLVKVGPGLGLDGKPLRDIVHQYERYLCGKNSSINESIFTEVNNVSTNINCDGVTDNSSPSTAIPRSSDNQTDDKRNKSDKPKDDFGPNDKFGSTIQKGSTSTPIPKNVASGPNSAAIRPNFSWASSSTSQPFSNNPITNHHDSFGPGHNSQNNQQYGNQDSAHCGTLPQFVAHNMDFPMMARFPARMPHPCPIHMAPRFHNHNPTPTLYGPFIGVRNPRPSPNVAPVPNNEWGNPGTSSNNQPPTPGTEGERNVHAAKEQHNGSLSTSVELSNLPLSTTFPLLSEKMAEVGQVISLELTRPGCALVRFATRAHAERCYHHFSKMCVMGSVIDVKFV
ncbi:uncharacterized protein [Battus philenor]|uniref:uncharacterized protein n=1 Tax=Battus philenor TaxID=42288 RepID=UPI0035CF2131